jgi:hypothetical protein
MAADQIDEASHFFLAEASGAAGVIEVLAPLDVECKVIADASGDFRHTR